MINSCHLQENLSAKILYKYLLTESNSVLKIIRNDPLEFITGVQGWFNIRKTCPCNSPYINRLEEKENHLVLQMKPLIKLYTHR